MRSWLLFLSMVLVLSACSPGNGEGLDANGRPLSESPPTDDDVTPGSFKQLQDDIFTPLCIVCHAGAAAPVGLKLDAQNSYISLVSVPSVQVPALLRVAPNDPQQSYLLQKLTGDASVGARMPLGGAPVSDELIDAVRTWIANGALPDDPTSDTPIVPIVAATIPNDADVLTTAPSSVALVFNTPMDFSRFTNDTVMLLFAGADATFDSLDDVVVSIDSITPSNPQTVQINVTADNLEDGDYLLTIGADESMPLLSLAGESLDGDTDGNPGGPFSLFFTVQRPINEPDPDTTAPSVALLVPMSPLSDQVDVQVAASDNEGVVAVRLLIDSVEVALLEQEPYLFSVDTTQLSDGDHTFVANATDAAGNVGQSAEITVTVDNAPPPDTEEPSVTFVPPVSPVIGQLLISATATDNVGIASVRLYIDNILENELVAAPFDFLIETVLLSNGDHTVRVEAQDTAGNISSTAEVTFTVDNPPPTDMENPVVSVEPLASPVSGSVQVVVNATDNVAVAAVELFVDDISQGTLNMMPYEFTLDTTQLSNGDHTVRATARDAAGNTSDSATLTISVDNQPPPDLQPPSVTIDAPDTPVAATATVTVAATDDEQVTSVSLYVDGVLINTLSAPPYDFDVDVSGLPDGVHIINASAIDNSANVGAATPQTITVENGTPQATLDWVQDNVFSASCAVGCHSDGGIASFLRLTDGDSFDDLVNELSTNGGPEFRVLPGDAANSSLMQRLDGTLTPAMPLGGALLSEAQRDAVRDWIDGGATQTPLDVIPPAVSVSLPPQPATGTVTLSAEALDDQTVSEVQFFVDGTLLSTDTVAPFEATLDTTSLANGAHPIDANAVDSSGNVGMAVTLTLTVENP